MLTTSESELSQEKLEGDPMWVVTLSNGLTVYNDDGRTDVEPASAWLRLQEYCRKNDLTIQTFRLRFRSHWEHAPANKDGYIFCYSALGSLFSDHTIGFYIIGYLENGKLIVQKWRVPELILDSTEERNLEDYRNLLI